MEEERNSEGMDEVFQNKEAQIIQQSKGVTHVTRPRSF